MSKPPWSLLGIKPTSDKEAIHAAYRKQLEKLDLSTSISRFAKLTEAREKALFQAAEMRRETARGGPVEAYAVQKPPEAPALISESTPPPPASSVAPTPTQPRNPPVTLRRSREGTEPTAVPNTYVDPYYDQPLPSQSAERPYRRDYISAPLEFDFGKTKGAVTKVWLALLVTAFLYQCVSGIFEDDSADPEISYSSSPLVFDTDVGESGDVLALELFGEGIDWDYIVKTDPYLAYALAGWITGSATADNDATRAILRTTIVEARTSASRADVIAISEVYLIWLKAAATEEGGACREVTSHAFFDGVPHIRGAELEQEQRLARHMLGSRLLTPREGMGRESVIPSWALQRASESSGLPESTITKSLEDFAHPQRCEATIALLEALLERPADAPLEVLDRL
ncbi:hypothetical protein [Qipengyuania marisflavi]|uniref:Uncharacterized protein n=1 Tax=Qipengyuania marisflavi TaxID=2486356 RepID=A0A5S3P4Z4_9SPHN|nr:hypothetical protein [Qipengyuania marisflavi]TMM48109.1 hypothetical protein FEV51_07335 [Qipengyuania marisflavi]